MSTLPPKQTSIKDVIYHINPEPNSSCNKVTIAKPEDSCLENTSDNKVELLIIKSENELLLDIEPDQSKTCNAQVSPPQVVISEAESPIEKAIKIEIEDHILIKEEDVVPVVEGHREWRGVARNFFYDLATFVNSLCDICDSTKVCRVIKLNKQERFLARQVLKKIIQLGLAKHKRVFTSSKAPKRACRQCFTKLTNFRSYLRAKIVSQRLAAEKNNQKMDPPTPHDKSCLCTTCQNPLNILLEGIDQTLSEQQQNNSLNSFSENVNYPDSDIYDMDSQQDQQSLPYTTNNNNNIALQNITTQDGLICNENPNTYYAYDNNLQPPMNYYNNFYTRTNNIECQASTSTTGNFMENLSSSEQFQNRLHSSDSSSSCTSDSVLPSMIQVMPDEIQPSTSKSPPFSSRKGKRICQYCSKIFTHTGDFTKHLRTHTKEKPFNCPKCGKSFPHTSNLHRHAKTHSDERPFRCEFCGKEFGRKDKLKSHEVCCHKRQKGQ